jgi:hypothetical protein
MGIPVLIIGESGSGKSASLRNFEPKEIGIINVAGKPLPFKSDLKKVTVNTDDYKRIDTALKGAKSKTIVIDDCQYLLANEFMRRGSERGYDKFTEIATNLWNLIRSINDLPDDVIVYFLGHTEVGSDGRTRFKTIGKLLDEKITVEGMFTVVLITTAADGKYGFRTQTNGADVAKSPMGMFETVEIDNDLKYVDQKIREYYEIQGGNN